MQHEQISRHRKARKHFAIQILLTHGDPQSPHPEFQRFGVLADRKSPLNAVLEFQLADSEIVKRLSGRRVCKSCGAIFHNLFEKPKVEGVCDSCGGQLIQRDDDKETVIQNRLDVYNQQTAPIINYYKKSARLQSISAIGEVSEISNRAIAALS